MRAARAAAWAARAASDGMENKRCVFENGEEVIGVCPETGWVAPSLWNEIDSDERWRLYRLTQEMLKKKEPPPSPASTPGGRDPTWDEWHDAHESEWKMWKEWTSDDEAAWTAYNCELATKDDVSLHDVALRGDQLAEKLDAVVEKMAQLMENHKVTMAKLRDEQVFTEQRITAINSSLHRVETSLAKIQSENKRARGSSSCGD